MAIAKLPLTDPSAPRPRWTRDAFHQLLERDVAESDRHYELIDGEIIEKMPQKEPHASLVMSWVFALGAIFGPKFLRCQGPIVVSDTSEPEPDVAVTLQPASVYIRSGNTPTAEDIRLVVEVSLTSLADDLGVKANLYARAGIPDYWVLDIGRRRLFVHRDPTPTGYASVMIYSDADSIAPLAAPDSPFRVADFLP